VKIKEKHTIALTKKHMHIYLHKQNGFPDPIKSLGEVQIICFLRQDTNNVKSALTSVITYARNY
jgi:hypothetical protein